MKLRTSLAIVPLLLASAVSLVAAKITGPVAAVTGAFALGGKPAEKSCYQLGCHNDLSSINLPGATLQILDAPATYVPDAIYTLRVRMTSTFGTAMTRRWGFQFTAVTEATGDSAGSFLPVNANTQIIPGIGGYLSRSYVEHTAAGTFPGTAGPTEWQVKWKAPNADVGRVFLFAAGNAADNSNTNNGDHIYTARDTVMPDPNVSAPAADSRVLALGASPNPARGSTTVRFALAAAAPVSIDVLDVQGRVVRELLSAERAAGAHTVAWDGRARDGAAAPAGLYFVRLSLAGTPARTARLALQR